MKKILNTILAAAVIIGFASCEKENNFQETSEEINETAVSAGHLVSSSLVSSIPFSEAYDKMISKAAESNIEGYDKLTDTEDIPNFLYTTITMFGLGSDLNINSRADIPSLGLQIKIWRVNYATKGGFEGKEDIVLTADVAFLTDEKGKLDRKLESISLYNSTYNAAEGDITYFRDIVIPMRAAHNALVVYPFYQGTYNDWNGNEDGHAVTPGEFLVKGRQAIDATLAAIELVNQISEEEKVSLAKNYYTENMGISNGGGTSLAVQYLLENDSEMIEANKTVRLKGTYIGEGCCSYSDIIPRIMENAPCPDEIGTSMLSVDDVKTAAYISAIIGAYYTWKIQDISKENPALASLKATYLSEDFLSKEFVNIWEPSHGTAKDYVEASLYGNLYWGIFGDFDGLRIEDAVNPAIVKDGNLDKDCEAMQDLINLFKKNDNVLLSGNWIPKAPIHFKHSKVDEFIPIEYVDNVYNLLSNNGSRKNVTIEYLEESGHILGSLSCTFIDVCLKKHPCPLNTSSWISK